MLIDIKGYEGLYAACDSGRIWAYPKYNWKGRYLKTWLIGHGYEMVMFYKNKKSRKFLVHRLIAQTYLPNPKNLKEVNHKNTNRLDNRVENLEWVNHQENINHAVKLGLFKNIGKNSPKGINHCRAKLNEKQVLEIRKRRKNGETSINLGKEFGVTDSLINAIFKRYCWKHI